VGTSWYGKVKEFKSPLHVVAAILLRSRETQLGKVSQLSQLVAELQSQVEQQQRQLQQKQKEIDALRQRAVEAEKQLDQAKQSVNLPDDPPIGTHGYGVRMISLAVNLARSVGFRGAVRSLHVFFQWLGIDRSLPSRTCIRNWLQRLGIDEMKQPLDSSESLVIMVDHSNQIGAEKVMLALGVNAAAMPDPGKALTHENVRVLEVKPGDCWKTADMEKEYEAIADRYGAPRAVLVDGAVELREGAKCLKNQREDTIVLRDFKHYAANVVKSIIGNDERFKEVGGKIGSTRSSIQQTELAHLTPPSSKQKARFMNLSRTLGWLTMILWLLRNPEAKAREGISDERMQEKLGWVGEYADVIPVWQECQDVVSVSLTFINEQGLFKGASSELRAVIGDELEHATSKELAQRLIDFVAESEQPLRDGERLPLSTEILESSFGLYKQLERQHSKSGFTSLLACLPALLKPTTPESVTAAFNRTSAKDVTAWTKKHFPSTVTSRRHAAYAEHKCALKRATADAITT
jgi:outer membrane murein-binding lipoprotein Lpp